MESLNLLIKNAILVQEHHPLNGKTTDILIQNGIIEKIAPSIENADIEQYTADGLHVSAGWFDLQATFPDPGFEHRETIQSGLDAAARGGFTRVLIMPHTHPSISTKSQVEYVLKQAKGHSVKLIPAGSLSAHLKGEELSEMYDMFSHGALAFTDGKQKVNSGLLSRALLYTREFGARIITYPSDTGFYGGTGQVNEGTASTFTGLKGMPALAEEAGVARDLYLSSYNKTPIHLTNISAAGSIALIRKAKQAGASVTAAVSWMNLCFTEERLLGFDQQYKVYPPLRRADDGDALIEAVIDGTISAIISDHTPLEIESKEVEFDDAAFGARGLEGMFAALCTFVPELPLLAVIKALTTGPATVLGMKAAEIVEGQPAELTLFCPNEKWTFTQADVPYGYANTPLMGMELTGKVKRIVGNCN